MSTSYDDGTLHIETNTDALHHGIHPRTFQVTASENGILLMATRRDHVGRVHSVTGHIGQNDLVKLVAFLTATALGVTEHGLVQSTDETQR